MKRTAQGIFALAAIMLAGQIFGQSQLQFTKTIATSEGAIQLYWQSECNALYQVQFMPDLSGNYSWQVLLDNYPSQGTNTLWLDTGDYSQAPPVDHPKYDPSRFYRVAFIGTNPVQPPSVAVTFPTNGAVLSGLATVSVATASTDLPFVTPSLYVDGQAMDSSSDGTNFVINTCEWPNGPHILFATAKGQDNISTQHGGYAVNTAYGASPYVAVTFNNLISRVAFSQQFFDPSLGQTQQVSAIFGANVNWTLQVLDEDSNMVRTVTGSGSAMTFNWDGTGNGGINLSNGIYYYQISAQTNGQPFQPQALDGGASWLSASWANSRKLFAMPANGSGAAVPLDLYPPGIDTNRLIIFESSWAEVVAARTPPVIGGNPVNSSGADDPTPPYSGPSSQSTAAPTRPATAPVRGPKGMYGVAYYDFRTTQSFRAPPNGQTPFPGHIDIEGQGTGSFPFTNIVEAAACATKFGARMQKGGWKEGFKKAGAAVPLNDLRKAGLGGNEIFGGVTIGFVEGHGAYGATPDFHQDASESLETYLVSDNPGDAGAPWFRLSEFGFGGSLRYMAILACNMLRDQNYQSMNTAGVLPIPSSLHLLCGCSSTAILTEDIGELWADNMCGRPGGLLGYGRKAPQPIKDAWINAGSSSYERLGSQYFLFAVNFRVAGWSSAMGDTVGNINDSTSGSITYTDRQVH